ncbi:MAG: hypothetical protein RIQ93_1743 [Verrucomicrobiota bacterium]|jgi:hypothetical protein
MPPLAELFPDRDYRLHLTLRRAEPAEFFAGRDESGRLLAERAEWLACDSSRYAALLPAGRPLLAEFSAMAAEWGVGELKDAHALGLALEPDVLFLSPDADGQFRLQGGALCFPTGWALEEKLGQTLDVIHGPVPGLNTALAAPIHQFLSKLKPGVSFLRDNWGLAGSTALNLHPAQEIPPPAAPVALDELWLRVEHQALLALPATGGVAFGIRIALHRLDEVARSPAAGGLRRALESMPPAMVAYKRLEEVRTAVIALLG